MDGISPEELSQKATDIIMNENNQLYLSSVNLWEMQIKLNLGKLRLEIPLQKMWNDMSLQNSIHLLPIANSHLWQLNNLEKHHKDPFDRLLIAQSQIENMELITKDKIIPLYDVKTIW
jgi:PIN domain nuclease of toxin-antitoxin system